MVRRLSPVARATAQFNRAWVMGNVLCAEEKPARRSHGLKSREVFCYRSLRRLLDQVLPLGFEVLEVGKLRDGCLDDAAAGVLELTGDRRDHRIPLANDLGQLANIAMLPIVAFIADL